MVPRDIFIKTKTTTTTSCGYARALFIGVPTTSELPRNEKNAIRLVTTLGCLEIWLIRIQFTYIHLPLSYVIHKMDLTCDLDVVNVP